MRKVDTCGMTPERALEYVVEWGTDGIDAVQPAPRLGHHEEVIWTVEAHILRSLADELEQGRNLRRLVKAMIGDAVKEALK